MEKNSIKFPSITEEYSGETITGDHTYIFEKIDGANVSIRRQGNKVVPWSRGGPVGRSNKYFFSEFRRFVYQKLSPEIFVLPHRAILFGEFTHPGCGHIPYQAENQHQFFLLSTYYARRGQFYTPDAAWQYVKGLGLGGKLRGSPLLHQGTVTPGLVERLLQEPSALYPGPKEGIVIHQYAPEFEQGLRLIKAYHPDFVEIDRSKEGAEQYCTVRRFIKAGQRLLESRTEITLDAIIDGALADIMAEVKGALDQGELREAIDDRWEMIQERVLPLFLGRP